MPPGYFLYLCILAAVVLIAGAGAVYWFALRPLPKTSGTITAPIASRATVVRDALGVPHISAGSIEDALFVQGFVTAQDRLAQMDGLRRLAGGHLSEVVGVRCLELDREARALRIERLAERHAQALNAQDRALLAAYARGVNHFIETHQGRLPLEFTALGYAPRPWRVEDSILVELGSFYMLTASWQAKLRKSVLLASGDAQKVEFLFPARTPGECPLGSNSWAVAGSRTASGRPLLANDPHVVYTIPGMWYLAHLKAPGLDVAGATIPGLPGVALGHNQWIAWGGTFLAYDVQDLYLEDLDPLTGRYVFRGQIEQADLERETISVKGQRPVELNRWVTRHGPVIADEGNRFPALRWVGAESGFARLLLDLNRARNWQEFTGALAHYSGPGQNFVYADVDGNIGYQAAGRFPIRRTHLGDVPADGSSGNFEWDGFIPFDELPRVYNPPSGVIASANQDPFPSGYPYRVSGRFYPPYRSGQITALLSAQQGWRAMDMLKVQTDVYSAFSHRLARQFVAAYDRSGAGNSALADAAAILRTWNGQMEVEAAAPLIVSLAYEHLRRAVGERACPGKAADFTSFMVTAALERLLEERPPGWFEDWDRLLVEVLSGALEEGRRMQGRDPREWKYGRHHTLLVAHAMGHQVPVLRRHFDIGPVPMSGSPTTVKKIAAPMGYTTGPSMRLISDLADWDQSLICLVAGQSGHVLSRHYKDHWKAYYSGRAFPFRFRRVEAKHTLVIEPE